MTMLSDPFAQVQTHFQAGRLAEARDLCCRILEAQPDHPDAWNALGLIAHEAGDRRLACGCLEKAVGLDGFNAFYHANLGEVYRLADRLEEAERSCRLALALSPALAEAHGNLGAALEARGKYEEALRLTREAQRLQPHRARWHTNAGNLLRQLKRTDEALASYNKAFGLEPDRAVAHDQFGLSLEGLDRPEEAEASYEEAIRLRPDLAQAHNHLANLWGKQGRLREAIRGYREALRLMPDFAETHMHLGRAYHILNQMEDSVSAFHEALRLKPHSAPAHNGLGAALTRQRKAVEAEAHLREAIRLDPRRMTAHSDLGEALFQQGRVAEDIQCLREGLRIVPKNDTLHRQLLFHLNFDPMTTPAALYEEHVRWGKLHGEAPAPAPYPNDPDPERPLRVGYVSADFRFHPVNRFFEPILANHDPARVEVFCYAEVPAPDLVTLRLKGLTRDWCSTYALKDKEVAERIRADGIDILVDLAGHTGGSRLPVFAHRPAPVQMTYLGYPNTTGLAAVNYRLTDEVADPPGGPRLHTEELAYLEGGFCCFAVPPDAPTVGPLPALANGHVTFGSPHNLGKLNARVLDLWARLLHAVPSSRLLLFRSGLERSVRERLAGEFSRRGIDPNRLTFREVAMHALGERGYLELYNGFDICLDAFPVSAHTTACEALCMGVPLVTLYGDRSWGRLPASVLTTLNMADWVARTPDEYVAVAARWCADLPGLAAVRAGLRGCVRDRLGDGPAFTRRLEATYRNLWRRWCDRRA